ncbi:MAG: winged helix-turn-helix transcriptional regulator [Leucobacter sp.]|nr:winged helix-turn-helix transcriptional regulator [Leucobacter sp.]
MIPDIISEFSQVFAAARSRWARYAEDIHPDLRGPGLMSLQTIIRRGPITATGLGGILDMDKAIISRQVAKLREYGLVDARAAESDKRVTLLTASAAAQAATDLMHARTAQEHSVRFADWSDDELEQLQTMLHRFNSSADGLRGEGPARRCAREESAAGPSDNT